MASLNRAGVTYARSLIAAGKVNKTAPWSFSAADGNKLLGPKGDDWTGYGKAHLGVNAGASRTTKDHWAYPFEKGGVLYRSALTAIRQRGGQQHDTEIVNAAGSLLSAVDKPKAGDGVAEHKDIAFELKMDGQGDGTFSGYGAVFGNVDRGGDLIRQGAFQDSLNSWHTKGKLPAMLWQHDSRQPIGVYTAMTEDAHGLHVQGRLTKGVRAADEAYALMKDGAIDGLSIGYKTVDSTFDADLGVRSLNQIDLFEVSPVTIPMNDAARITAVKAAESISTIREFEDFLRDVGGFSHAAAKSIASGGFKALPEPRDEDGIGDAITGPFDALVNLIKGK